MPERVNIARIAEVVSAEIFAEFGWKPVGPPNESWTCVVPDQHKRKDHPTDVTFFYEDPYAARNVHLITDLKSYAAGSIKPFSLRETIESLASAVDCAKSNPHWKKLYLQPGASHDIQGLLFVYNHDAQYDKDFGEELNSVFQEDLKIPKGVRISVLGPDDVWYLTEILSDIAMLARRNVIPHDRAKLNFYYHNDSRKRLARFSQNVMASIDVLKGKYQILSFLKPGKDASLSSRGLLVYYRGPGADIREFIFLIDMLRHHGLLDDAYDEIYIRGARGVDLAPVNFQKAVQQYAVDPDASMPEKLKKINYSSVPSVRPQITNFEVALKGA